MSDSEDYLFTGLKNHILGIINYMDVAQIYMEYVKKISWSPALISEKIIAKITAVTTFLIGA